MYNRPAYSPKRIVNNYKMPYKMPLVIYQYNPYLNKKVMYFNPYFSVLISIIFTASFAKIASYIFL